MTELYIIVWTTVLGLELNQTNRLQVCNCGSRRGGCGGGGRCVYCSRCQNFCGGYGKRRKRFADLLLSYEVLKTVFFRFYKPFFRTMILQWFLTPALTGPSEVPIRRFFRNLFPSLSKMSKLFQEQSESGKKTGTKYGWGGWGWGTERCEDCPPVSGNSLIFSAFKSFT